MQPLKKPPPSAVLEVVWRNVDEETRQKGERARTAAAARGASQEEIASIQLQQPSRNIPPIARHLRHITHHATAAAVDRQAQEERWRGLGIDASDFETMDFFDELPMHFSDKQKLARCMRNITTTLSDRASQLSFRASSSDMKVRRDPFKVDHLRSSTTSVWKVTDFFMKRGRFFIYADPRMISQNKFTRYWLEKQSNGLTDWYSTIVTVDFNTGSMTESGRTATVDEGIIHWVLALSGPNYDLFLNALDLQQKDCFVTRTDSGQRTRLSALDQIEYSYHDNENIILLMADFLVGGPPSKRVYNMRTSTSLSFETTNLHLLPHNRVLMQVGTQPYSVYDSVTGTTTTLPITPREVMVVGATIFFRTDDGVAQAYVPAFGDREAKMYSTGEVGAWNRTLSPDYVMLTTATYEQLYFSNAEGCFESHRLQDQRLPDFVHVMASPSGYMTVLVNYIGVHLLGWYPRGKPPKTLNMEFPLFMPTWGIFSIHACNILCALVDNYFVFKPHRDRVLTIHVDDLPEQNYHFLPRLPFTRDATKLPHYSIGQNGSVIYTKDNGEQIELVTNMPVRTIWAMDDGSVEVSTAAESIILTYVPRQENT